jgi:glutamate--cysteine ligase
LDGALSEAEARELIISHAFSRDRAGRIGVELEWLVHPGRPRSGESTDQDPVAFVSPQSGDGGPILPAGGSISLEPGGQVELSTLPAGSLGECAENAATDLAALRALAARHGVELRGSGLDDRPPRLRVALPRYLALERYYRQIGGAGPTLLCSTASVQVNVDAGDGSAGWRGRGRRWSLANALGPVLMAMFANSPAVVRGVPARSGRQVLRLRTDPARSGPLPPTDEPRSLWADYALATRVVSVRSARDDGWEVPAAALTLRRWLRGGGPRPVYPSDVLQHLKSLVAPVRACGHLELRMIDAQGDDDWIVPLAVVAALLDDERSSDAAWRLVKAHNPAPGRADWLRAAEHGLSEPALAATARAVVRIASTGLRGMDVQPWVREAVGRYADTYTLRGLSPADVRRSNSAAVA